MKKRGNSFLYIGGGITAAMVALILVGFFWTPYNTTRNGRRRKISGSVAPASAGHGQLWPRHLQPCAGGSRHHVPDRHLRGGHRLFLRYSDRQSVRLLRRHPRSDSDPHLRLYHCISRHPAGSGHHQPDRRRHLQYHHRTGHSLYPQLCPHCARRICPLPGAQLYQERPPDGSQCFFALCTATSCPTRCPCCCLP